MGKRGTTEERIAKVLKNSQIDGHQIRELLDSYFSTVQNPGIDNIFIQSVSDVLKGKSSKISFGEKQKSDVFDSNTDIAYLLINGGFVEESTLFTNICKEIAGNNDPDVLMLEGRLSFCKKDYQTAQKKFRQIRTNNVTREFKDLSFFWEGECYASIGEFEKAFKSFSKIKVVDYYKNLGKAEVFFDQKKYQKAIKIIRKEIKKIGIAIQNEPIWSLFTESCMRIGAEKEFLKAKHQSSGYAAYNIINDTAFSQNGFIFNYGNNKSMGIIFSHIYFYSSPNHTSMTEFPVEYDIHIFDEDNEILGKKYNQIPLVRGRFEDIAQIVRCCFQDFFQSNKKKFSVTPIRAQELFLEYALEENTDHVFPYGQNSKSAISRVKIPLSEFGFAIPETTLSDEQNLPNQYNT